MTLNVQFGFAAAATESGFLEHVFSEGALSQFPSYSCNSPFADNRRADKYKSKVPDALA